MLRVLGGFVISLTRGRATFFNQSVKCQQNLDKTILDPIWGEINRTDLFRRDRRDATKNKQMNGIVYRNFRINEAIIKSHLLLESANSDIISSGFSYLHPTRGLGHLLSINNGQMRTKFVNSIHYSTSLTFLDPTNARKNAKINHNNKTFGVCDSSNEQWKQTQTELHIKQENGTNIKVKFNPKGKTGIFLISVQ